MTNVLLQRKCKSLFVPSRSMSPVTTAEMRLAEVVSEISSAKMTLSEIRRERRKKKAELRKAENERRYYEFLQWVRAPANRHRWYKDVVIAIVPLCFSLSVFAISVAIGASGYFILFGVPVSFGILFLLLLGVMCRPTNAALPARIQDAAERAQIAAKRMAAGEVTDRLPQCEAHLHELEVLRSQLVRQVSDDIASGKRLRAELLLRNWKAMRDYEWEDYLLEVCTALGGQAERIGGAGDQGVDLIVTFGAHRIAVQAKGYFNTVNNKAIQEAYAGMTHHKCTGCAVITNSRFTRGAMELAASTRCVLVGEQEFPDFVLGKLRIVAAPR